MQESRRKDFTQSRGPTDGLVSVPAQYWDDLGKKAPTSLCDNAVAQAHGPGDLVLPVLGKEILVDIKNHSLMSVRRGEYRKVEYPLLELLVLLYLLNAKSVAFSNQLVSIKELKTAHFFQGPHELNVGKVLERFGGDLKGFRAAAESLGGAGQNLVADAAYRIPAFPKVPLYYLLWEGDDEFEPRLSVLFDRSIESHLSADAIWGLVGIVSEALIKFPQPPF
jgi:Domain of unknown function (DUF3786)